MGIFWTQLGVISLCGGWSELNLTPSLTLVEVKVRKLNNYKSLSGGQMFVIHASTVGVLTATFLFFVGDPMMASGTKLRSGAPHIPRGDRGGCLDLL
eukprot:m.112626 g.112626  ORF g.112626 m.112626 type:complete len:97 (+) comp28205_c0_seq1:200-490(+)